MTIKELIIKNRSYRRFYQEIKLTNNQLKDIVNLARLSASPKNLQALKFWICNSDEINEKIFPSLAWAGYLPEWTGPVKGERPSSYIFILADKNISSNFQNDFLTTASGIAAQSILLGVTEIDFGGCIIAAFKKNKIIEAILLSENLDILLILAIGKPKEDVVLQEIEKEGSIKYWRNDKDQHFVPKRKLDDIIKVL